MTDPSHILIIRTSAIGDVVMASFVAEGLHGRFPRSEIHWLAEPQVTDLLSGNPHIHRLIPFPKSRWKGLLRRGKILSLLRELRIFSGDLRSGQYDLVVDLQGLFRTRLAAWLTRAPRRIGFYSKEPGKGLLTRLVPKAGDACLMSSEYRFLLQSMDIATDSLKPVVHVSGKFRAGAARVLAAEGVSRPYAVFAPFTTRPQKHWLESRWCELAKEIRKMGMTPVIAGGPADAESAARIVRDSGAVGVAGKTGLGEVAAIVEGAALLIGVDTGLTHLGTAFGIPTIALFGATCPYLKTSSPLTRVLYDRLPCSPCRRSPSCGDEFPCMAALTVPLVMENVTNLLSMRDQG